MTIRDVELATGMTRANIRFYEEQGLIVPERQANGYRDYTQTHVDILMRVKLLRSLHMSIDKIRQLQTGQADMIAALDEQIQILSREQRQLEASQRVCKEMRDDRVAFETLDAQRYLRSMDTPPSAQTALNKDVQPVIRSPWRRYFARILDYFFYGMVVALVDLYWADGKMPNLLSTILTMGLMVLLEPVQLRLFGTTLGKWIFGIRVTDLDGHHLFYSEGMRRTFGALFFGMGLQIPIVSLWRQWRSYKFYADGIELIWEEDSELTIRDDSKLRFLAAIGAAAVAYGATILLAIPSFYPAHRGDLTIAQFCQNYREMEQRYELEDEYILADDGSWQARPFDGTAYVHMATNSKPLKFVFTTDDNGFITAISFSEEITGNRESWLGTHMDQQLLTAMAFVCAREDFSFLRGDDGQLLDTIQSSSVEDYAITVAGVRIDYDIEYSGYFTTGTGLIPDENQESAPWFSMEFRLETIG